MEPEVVDFLKRVALSIFFVFCWLVLTVIIGLKFDPVFTNASVSAANVVFYVWMIISLISLLLYLIKIWKKTEKW